MKRFYHFNRYFVTILIVAIFTWSCKSKIPMIKTTISLTSLMKAQPDSFSKNNETLLKISKIYPTQKECNTTEIYANLFICSKLSNGDTVYVFEECQKISQLAFDTINNLGVVAKYNMITPSSDKVRVFVPINFKVNSRIKYFSAKLSFLSEY